MIEIWHIDLAAAAPALVAVDEALGLTSAAERARAARQAHHDAAAGLERRASYAALRLGLERLEGPLVRGRAMEESPSGKPSLPGAGVSFSLAHTQGHALVAVTRALSVGIDLELPREPRLPAERRSRIEAAALVLGPPLDAAHLTTDWHRFSQAWTRLEAYAKADGRGMGLLLAGIGVFGPERVRDPQAHEAGLTALRAAAAAYMIADLALPEGLLGAICLAGAALDGPLPAVRSMPATQAELIALSTRDARMA